MKQAETQTLNKIRSKYKKGTFFDFTSVMSSLLTEVLGKVVRGAKAFTIDFNELDDANIEETEKDAANESKETIKNNILSIDNELRDKVNALVEKHGDSKDLQNILIREISKDFAQKYTKGRISVISITETTKIYGKVARETIKKNGKVSVWQHTGRGKTDRASHKGASGQEIDEEKQAFYVGGEWVKYPGDGSPKNSVNCHCILVSK